MTRLVGESLREIAILIVVFVPLEFYVQGSPLTITASAAIIASIALLMGLGLFLEVH